MKDEQLRKHLPSRIILACGEAEWLGLVQMQNVEAVGTAAHLDE